MTPCRRKRDFRRALQKPELAYVSRPVVDGHPSALTARIDGSGSWPAQPPACCIAWKGAAAHDLRAVACRALRKSREGVGELRRTVAFKSGGASRRRDCQLAPRDAVGSEARGLAVAHTPIQTSGSRSSRVLDCTKSGSAVDSRDVTASATERKSGRRGRGLLLVVVAVGQTKPVVRIAQWPFWPTS